VTADSHQHAFLWNAGTMTDLGTLGGTTSSATAINERGQVIGTSTTPGGATHGFIWQNGRMIDLGSFFGADSTPAAINDQGEIVGAITTPLGNPIVAFKWENGHLTNLGRFGAPAAQAQDVNNNGVILVEATNAAGNPKYALIVDHGKTINLGSLGGAPTMARQLNDRNQAIGLSFTRNPRGRRSFVWQHGTMTALPTYDGVSPPWGDVSKIDDVGDVIGTAYLPHRQAGVIWKPINR
jgi:probable HAF family extracellular repeat protein